LSPRGDWVLVSSSLFWCDEMVFSPDTAEKNRSDGHWTGAIVIPGSTGDAARTFLG